MLHVIHAWRLPLLYRLQDECPGRHTRQRVSPDKVEEHRCLANHRLIPRRPILDAALHAKRIRCAVRARNIERSTEASFVLPLAPDRLHKENVSGGPPYGVVLPDGCVDGLFMGETTMPFVSYLNWVFRNGGFPCSTGSDSQWRVKRALAKDLLPL
jgi:hypothetical protein